MQKAVSDLRNHVFVIILMILVILAAPINTAQAIDLVPIPAASVLVSPFPDLSSTDANAIYVKYLVSKGIINGYSDGKFHPTEALSRAQAATVIVKAADLKINPTARSPFRDVSQDHWAKNYIAAAASAGYLKGLPDGSYQPEEKLTRAQGISLLLRLSQQEMSGAELPALTDIDLKHWAAQSVAVGLASGMVGLSSDGKQYLPDAPFTRINLSHALGVILTEDPSYNNSSLNGKIRPISGVIKIRNSQGQEQEIRQETSIDLGDTIITGANSSCDLIYPDGSSLLIKENGELSIQEARGRKYIKTDGNESIAIDWLNLKLKKGTMFGALATKQETDNQGEKKAEETSNLNEKKSGDIYQNQKQLIASQKGWQLIAADNSQPWWKVSQTKKVKIKVDMPWGVAAIRGTFFEVSVGSNGNATVSCLTGNAEVSNGGVTIPLGERQETHVVAPNAAPAPTAAFSIETVKEFVAEKTWIENTAQTIDQAREVASPPPPPIVPEQPVLAPSLTQQAIIPAVPATQVIHIPTTVQVVIEALESSGLGNNPLNITPPVELPSPSPSQVIITIDNISATVAVGESYSLPTTVTAHMSNNSSQQVPVSWTPATVNTSVAGIYTFSGNVSRYNGTVTLTLIVEVSPSLVIPIEQPPTSLVITNIDNISATAAVGESYSLPTSVTARMSDNSNQQVQVSWMTAMVNTDTAGSYTFSGSVSGYSGIVNLTLTVEGAPVVVMPPSPPTPVITGIDNISATVATGQTYSMPTTVTARMSDNSSQQVTVNWAPTTVNTNWSGTTIFQGTVAGYNGTVSLTLVVYNAEPSTATISVEPANNNAINTGQVFRVAVRAAGVQNMYALEIHMTFDSQALAVVDENGQAVSATANGSIFTSEDTFVAQNRVDNANGKVDFAGTFLGKVAGYTGSGEVCTFYLKTKSQVSSMLTLNNIIMIGINPETSALTNLSPEICSGHVTF